MPKLMDPCSFTSFSFYFSPAQAKHEEITTDYSNLQQQYVRLSEDHQKIVNGQKEDFERLKDTKDKESRSLQGQS